MSSPALVVHNASRRRFEDHAGDSSSLFLSYTFEGDCVVFDRTCVPEVLRGRGIAAKLARAALDEARQRRWKVVPRCPYVATFIERNPEYSDLVDRESRP
jgi:predicted GNAT family acetyltransferase